MKSAPRRPKNDQASSQGELVQRVISATVLVILAALFTVAGVWPFALMVSLAGAVLAWEWGRLVRGRTWDIMFYVHAGCVVLATLLSAAQSSLWLPLGILATGSVAAIGLTTSVQDRLWSALGILYLGAACCLLVIFRSDPTFGVVAVFFLFLIVSLTDTAAYFVGRTLRGPKLAPAISPGKTWSGFLGGIAVPMALAYVFAKWLGGTSALGLMLAGAGLSIAAQIGDLAESAIKRNFEVKDSGQLLPGHGGLFDRVDGLIGAVLAAGCLAGLRDTLPPSQAFLIWP